MKIIPLSEGAFTIDKTKLFVPFDVEKDELQQRPTGSLLVEVQPFVLITSEDIILLDAGLGFEKNGELQIHGNLKAAGIEPSQITKVLVSHLHKDHAGGLSFRDKKTNQYAMSFSNATYYIQQQELSYALNKGLPSYIPDELECLQNSSRIELFKGDGIIDGYIRYEITGAHCPYHQVFWIIDGGEKIFYGGDEAPQLQQMKSRFIAKYDYDGKKSMELRQKWWRLGEEENWTFLFYHDINTPVWKF